MQLNFVLNKNCQQFLQKKKLTYGNARLAQKPLYKSISNTFLPSTEHYKGGETNAVSFIRNELL